MRFRLSPAAYVVGIKREHFRSMRRQNLFPRMDKVPSGEAGDQMLVNADLGLIDQKWADYGLDELVPLRAMVALMVEGGLNAADASAVIVNAWGDLDEEFHAAQSIADFEACLKGPECWIGVETSVAMDGTYFRSHYAGTIPEIYMASEARATRDRRDYGATRVRLVLVSVSGAIRYVLSRACNLPVGEDQ